MSMTKLEFKYESGEYDNDDMELKIKVFDKVIEWFKKNKLVTRESIEVQQPEKTDGIGLTTDLADMIFKNVVIEE